LFEGGVRTPAFIHSPLLSSESRGTTFEGLFHVSDWLPTIMGGMLNSNIDSRSEAKEWYGINQWDAMTSSSNDADMGSTSTFPRTELLLNIDYLDSEGHVNDGIKVGLIKDNYKLIMNEVSVDWFPVPEDETEVVEERLKPANFLFNLKEDPTEAINLVGKQRDIMKDLRVQMKTYMDTLLQPSNFRPDDSASAWTAWQRNDESDHPLLGPWLSDDVSEGLLTSNVLKNYPDRWHFETDMILDKKSASSTIMNEEGEMISKDDA
jgi:arylsulfatase A-like enzyme